MLLLETDDQLEQALGSRRVIEYTSQDTATPTALPSPTPITLSPLFLQESAGDMLLAAVPRPKSGPPHPSCSYALGANEYPSEPFLLDSQQADSNEDNDSPTASPLFTPVPHLLRESYDDSYDMSVRPLIGCETTPFFNLAPVSAASSPPTPPPYILYPPSLISLYTAKMPDRQFFPAINTLCSFVVINNLAYRQGIGACSYQHSQLLNQLTKQPTIE